jgi:ribose transport system permease protein
MKTSLANRLNSRALALIALRFAPLMLFVALCIVFGTLSDRFLSLANFRNILAQSTHVAVMAIGMTFVLLVRGVDLSVGSVMYLVAVAMGLYLSGLPLALSIPAIVLIGAVFGGINACFITGLNIASFIVTLATLFIFRGLALYLLWGGSRTLRSLERRDAWDNTAQSAERARSSLAKPAR